MTQPLRDRRDGVAALLEEARVLKDTAPASEARVWRRLERSLAPRPRRSMWIVLGVAIPAAAALALFLRPSTEGPRLASIPEPQLRAALLTFPGVGQVRPMVGARVRTDRITTDRLLYLDEGELEAGLERSGGPPLVVVTPTMRVTILGTRVLVAASHGRARVVVGDGQARIELGAAVVLAGPGEEVTSDDPRLLPRRALVDPLAEENALFARARAAERAHEDALALELYAEHARRFPTGVLAPERVAAVVAQHLGAGRCDEAAAQLVVLAALASDDPRLSGLRAALARCNATAK